MPDPTQTLTVEVTQEDIGRNSTYIDSCPLALAMSRALGQPVKVGFYRFWINDECGFDLPIEAVEFRKKHDERRGIVSPFTFPVTVPASCVRKEGEK